MHREDFNMLSTDIIYLDNGATALKTKVLSETISDYYNNYSVNSHRGDYDLSLKVDTAIDRVRNLVKDFINAESEKEIAFTAGTTASLNQIIFGYYSYFMHSGDEVIITNPKTGRNTYRAKFLIAFIIASVIILGVAFYKKYQLIKQKQ